MTATANPERPRLGVFKLTSCDGCQLTLLDCEDELLLLAATIDIVHFPEGVSPARSEGPFDLAIIEGSVSTAEQLQEVKQIRSQSRVLVTIGACATSGGIQALRNFVSGEEDGFDEFRKAVYARPEYVDSLATSTPVSQHVAVDFELRGCPIDKRQLLELITAYLRGRTPAIKNESVCFECKRRGTVCVVVTDNTPCLGPVTHAGCGAICPAFRRGCYGCFGPRESAATESLATQMKNIGRSEQEILRSFRLFTAASPEFEKESKRHE
ncbi:oxidoreductase [Pseudomaricurvus alkylphenolicus]|uniref:NADH-quinone oxidoreductase subunit B family protein n=1 Tax=Pseudomaricurvus alkylphenolicus TaxID=1306991 RepID=UPI00142424A0|nr:oxidoreductase [Pseudomaricurvus alkylphenolicus]NIB45020.1 oxidoreductase [Pseudomaricurvus alkylphenolicus]